VALAGMLKNPVESMDNGVGADRVLVSLLDFKYKKR
jgi:hypothetical protein